MIHPFPAWAARGGVGSANKEDDFVINHFNNKKGGVVVDIGAADGITTSNSYKLIKEFDWEGILIEPLPEFYQYAVDLYADNNKVTIHNNAVDSQRGEAKLWLNSDLAAEPGYSSLSSRVAQLHQMKNFRTVTALTFNDLPLPQKIDFLTIDAEAKDWDIIKAIDFDFYEIELLLCEKSFEDLSKKIYDFMIQKNYRVVHNNNWIFAKNKK